LRTDETGKTYGPFTVIRPASPEETEGRPKKVAYWLVHCKLCNRNYLKAGRNLRAEHIKCKCEQAAELREMSTKDLTDTTSGFLKPRRLATTEERAQSTWKKIARTAFWVCDCTCGEPNCKNVVVLPAKALVPGPRQVKSCGSLRGTVARQNAANRKNGKFMKPGRSKGRPKGTTPEVQARKREMLEAWDRGDYGTNKAAYARRFKFHRPDASKIIDAHEANKA
jgi:hypothetical protein